jgi:hypothetical protein
MRPTVAGSIAASARARTTIVVLPSAAPGGPVR